MVPLSPQQSDTDPLLAGLNEQQRDATTGPFDRHCLVLAGAGCGKTAVLTRRIAYCARTFCAQERILALTFTRKAAEEMKARVIALPGMDNRRPLPKLTTFHGFGLGVLRDTIDGVTNATRLGYTGEPSLLAPEKRLEILARVTSLAERKALGVDLLKLDDIMEWLAINSPRIGQLSADRRRLAGDIAARFAQEKRRANVWEFSDMIGAALEVMGQENVARHYGSYYQYILVDEFQDTNPLQIELLRKVLCAGSRAFAVGDDDQAIYAFRGADTGPILNFPQQFENARVVKLETNYRSRPSILRSANRIFADKPAAFRKVLRSGRYGERSEAGPRPVKRRFRTQEDLLDWIDETSARLARSEGVAVEKHCILFRLNETLDWSKKYLSGRMGENSVMPKMQTVHGSKGLEFPVVYLCDLEESLFPHYRRRSSARIRTWGDLVRRILKKRSGDDGQGDIEEERRLFYVGVTRAEHRLYLLSVRKKILGGRSVALEPSRFLKLC